MSLARESASIPKIVGGYRLEEKIGSGAMGTVYRAADLKLGRQVALKVVRTDDPQSEMCRRFLQEGIAAARVRHPNVVQVLDAGEEADLAYLAMQLLEGETLSECLSRQGRLPVPYGVDLILPVCAALQAAHDVGVLHRDLKPANIFLTDVGRGEPEPMLLDFGISKIEGPVNAALTQNPRFLGTPLYIAPEQADGASGSALSDQYSLALSLYETLLGLRPFERFQNSLIQLLRHVAEGDIKAPRELDPSIPDGLDQALMRALSTNPADRFSNMRDFGAALLPYATEARRTLWQMTFVDVERTMASANGPVGDSHRNRRVQVSVDSSSSAPGTEETIGETTDGEFLSHSKLFGGAASDAPLASSFDPAQSSISRRTLPEIDTEFDEPLSSSGSPRPPRNGKRARQSKGAARSSEAAASPRHPSALLGRPSSKPPEPATSKRTTVLTWLVSALVAGATIFTTVALVRYELSSAEIKTYKAHVTVLPSEAEIQLDGHAVGTGQFSGDFPIDGVVHRLTISHPGYQPTTLVFVDHAPVGQVTLDPWQPQVSTRKDEAPEAAPTSETVAESAKPGSKTSADVPSNARKPSAAIASPKRTDEKTPQAIFPSEDTPPPQTTTNATASTPADSEPAIVTGNLDPWAQ